MKKKESKPSSVISLIAVNLFPLYGVYFWGWDVFPLMLLFWAENVFIGFYNVLRMMTCRSSGDKIPLIGRAFMILFFIIHYGGFIAGHGVFVVTLFGQTLFENTDGPRLNALLQVVRENRLPLAMCALFLSHGYSFITNYLGRGEYKRHALSDLMVKPYSRVIILHITLVLGAFLVMALKSPTLGLLLFILLKTMMDLAVHLKEHQMEGMKDR